MKNNNLFQTVGILGLRLTRQCVDVAYLDHLGCVDSARLLFNQPSEAPNVEDVVTSPRFDATLAPAAVAREVLREYWNGKLPVNPGQIALDMGIKLVPVNELHYEYSGHYRVGADGVPVIEYNNTESLVRKRFTVAHEIGHHMLGHGARPRGDCPASFRAGTQDPRERTANQFAAELLMPSDALRTLVASGKFSSVDELASAFAVSKIAMSYRLSNLRLAV